MKEKGQRTRIELVVDEEGVVYYATENGKGLVYDDTTNGKTMDDGKTTLQSNPCRWIKIGGRWRCI